MMNEDGVRLIPGSRYRIESLASRDAPIVTQGIFKGYTRISEGVTALAIQVEEPEEVSGMIRIIPTHMILAIDILSAAEVEETDEGEVKVYFR